MSGMKFYLVMCLDYYNKPMKFQDPGMKNTLRMTHGIPQNGLFFLDPHGSGPWEGRCDPFLPSKSWPSCAIAQGACGRRSEWNRTTTTEWVDRSSDCSVLNLETFFWVSLKKKHHTFFQSEFLPPGVCFWENGSFFFELFQFCAFKNPRSFFQRFHLQQLFKIRLKCFQPFLPSWTPLIKKPSKRVDDWFCWIWVK